MPARYRLQIEFVEPILGTVAFDPEIFSRYIASKSPDTEAEVATLPSAEEAIEQASTGFHRLDGTPALYDYQIKGYFKEAAGMLKRASGTQSSKLTAHKKIIDGLLFVEPRLIPVWDTGPVTFLERPIRAQTAQGERVALVRSESLAAGSKLLIELVILAPAIITGSMLHEWLDYGALRGMGQWRNGSYGRFQYTLKLIEEADAEA